MEGVRDGAEDKHEEVHRQREESRGMWVVW